MIVFQNEHQEQQRFYFIFLNVYSHLLERPKEEEEALPSDGHSPNATVKAGASLKTGVWNSIQVSHMAVRGPSVGVIICCL